MKHVRKYAGHLVLLAFAAVAGLVANPIAELPFSLGVLAFIPVTLMFAFGRKPPLGYFVAICAVGSLYQITTQGVGASLALVAGASGLMALGVASLREKAGPDPMAVIALGLLGASFVPAGQYYQSVLSLRGTHDVDIFAIFGSSLAVAIVILATLGLLTGRYRERHLDSLSKVSGSLWFPAPTSGILPLVIAFTVLNAATAYFGGWTLTRFESIEESSITTSYVWPFVRLFVVAVTFVAFTAIFNPSKAMKHGWARAMALSGGQPEDAEPLLVRARRRAMWTTLVYLLALTAIYEWAGELSAALGVIAVSFFTAIVYDVRSELNFRNEEGFYVTIFEPEAVWQVPHVRASLEARGIPVFVRGWGLRSLLRILGFWGDLEVMIPGEHLDEAEEVVRSLGLRPPNDHREDKIEEHYGEDDHGDESEEQ